MSANNLLYGFMVVFFFIAALSPDFGSALAAVVGMGLVVSALRYT